MELLQKINNYENEYVVKCFLRNFSMNETEAIDVFNETKKWLYLCYCIDKKSKKEGLKIPLYITPDMLIIDEMWHTFILCTLDYSKFCEDFFSMYIHHYPSVEKGEGSEIEKVKKMYKNNLKLIYEYLGEETLDKWFNKFADKYTKDYILQIYNKF